MPSLALVEATGTFGERPLIGRKRAELCIHYEAYCLAADVADPQVAAQAVLAACDVQMTQAAMDSWFASFNAHDEGGLPPGYQAVASDWSEGPPCALQGKPCAPGAWDIEKVRAEADRKTKGARADLLAQALFRVVEAKARRCRAPAKAPRFD